MSIGSFPAADFTPQLVGYTGQGAFRFWCQKVLPIVYDDSLSYYELLNKVVIYLNNAIKDVASNIENVEKLLTAYNELQDYVNHYFDSLDVQEEINSKLDELNANDELSRTVAGFIARSIGYTTPEAFGADGDGVSDDYQAIVAAINSGANVIFGFGKTYRTSRPITVNDAVIDFNYATIIHDGNVGIRTVPTYKGSTRLVADAINTSTLTVSDAVDIEQNDILVVVYNPEYHDPNAEFEIDKLYNASRRYYRNGGVFLVKRVDGNRVLVNPEIEFTQFENSDVFIFKPTTTHLNNVGDIQPSDPSLATCGVNLFGCLNATLDGFMGSSVHNVYIGCNYCYGTRLSNLNFESKSYSGITTDRYGIIVGPSSLTWIDSCTIVAVWHAITTGGAFLIDTDGQMAEINTILTDAGCRDLPAQYLFVDKCYLACGSDSNGGTAFIEHGNTFKTFVSNSAINGLGICGGGAVDNVVNTIDNGFVSLYINGGSRPDTACDLVVSNMSSNFDVFIVRNVAYNYKQAQYNKEYQESWTMYVGKVVLKNSKFRHLYPARARGYVYNPDYAPNEHWQPTVFEANTVIEGLVFDECVWSGDLYYQVYGTGATLKINEIRYTNQDIECSDNSNLRWWYGTIGKISFINCNFKGTDTKFRLYQISRAQNTPIVYFQGCDGGDYPCHFNIRENYVTMSDMRGKLIVTVGSNSGNPATLKVVNSEIYLLDRYLNRAAEKPNLILNTKNTKNTMSESGTIYGDILTDTTTFDKYNEVFSGGTLSYSLITLG